MSIHTEQAQFQFEAEMTASVARWLRRSGLIVKPEFSLPWGICDLVGVRFDPEKVRRRLSYGQTKAVGPSVRLHIFSRIPECESGKSVTLQKLTNDFSSYMTPDVLLRELRALMLGRFVISPRRGYFQKLNGWAPLHSQILAVELKLGRVSEAMSQAVANRAFATHSYIALPGRLAARVVKSSRAEPIRHNGIGVIGVWRHMCRELLKPSDFEAPHNEVIQAHVVERFWRTRGN